MNRLTGSADANPAIRLLFAQLIVTAAMAAVGMHWSETVARSLAAGGVIGLLGSAYFARQAFRFQASEDAKKAARSFFKGLAGKLVLVAIGFVLALKKLHPVSGGALFTGFAVVQLTVWLSPFWIERR